MTQEEQNSSNEQDLSTPATKQYSITIGMGIIGTEEECTRFASLWITDSERRAHRIVEVAELKVTLLPLPEDFKGAEV